jgi:hypothetical protein
LLKAAMEKNGKLPGIDSQVWQVSCGSLNKGLNTTAIADRFNPYWLWFLFSATAH